MRRTLTLLLIVFCWSPITYAQSAAQSRAFAFTHVTVIDTLTGKLNSDATVVIEGERIVAVGKTGRVRVPREAEVLDATGKFLIPGLWDMHFHTPPDDKQGREIFLPLAIANGVTGIRNMFGYDGALKQRSDLSSGKLLGPRMILASPVVDGPVPMWPGSIAVADPAAGRETVRTLKQSGYDFIKVYQFLRRETYFAIADESKKQNIPIAGHVPFSLTAREASDAGQKSFEHLFGLGVACSADEERLRPSLAAAAAQVDQSMAAHMALFVRNESEPLASYDEAKAVALFKHLARNGTYAVPTLVLHYSLGLGPDPPIRNDPRLKYMPANIRQIFVWELPFFPNWKPVYERMSSMTATMHRAGMKILAGTDTPNTYCFPGFGLHDELELFVKAGLTPLEALQTATVNAAAYLNLSRSLGTIEKGKLADLVLLDANPLQTIGNTRRIAGVVVNGKYLPKTSLEKILADVEAVANKN
jgi:imidazolonepropionase-like amidohydrolase